MADIDVIAEVKRSRKAHGPVAAAMLAAAVAAQAAKSTPSTPKKGT